MLIGCRIRQARSGLALVSLPFLFASCTARPEARIEFTSIPEARFGGPDALDTIEGRIIGARPGKRVVLFAKTDRWWVQPFANHTVTSVDSKGRWKSATHYGTEYAALLVDSHFIPPATSANLPEKGGAVLAVARVPGRQPAGKDVHSISRAPKQLRFSGFDWDVRTEPSGRGGSTNEYHPANAWVDDEGRLHLRITRGAGGWKCSEVRLKDPLGYGTYAFTVQEVTQFEPAAVLGIFTFDDTAPDQNNREMNIEVSQWGDPSNKNAQFAIQPYYVPANVVRFNAPSGRLMHSLRWTQGRAHFRTSRHHDTRPVADYTFTSGVPSFGHESLYIALYPYGKAGSPLTKETEVVVDRFEYIP
jgi:hypothetical protein